MNSDYLEAEYSVIGSVLINPFEALQAASVLTPGDFTVELNREIYKTVLAMREAGECIDPVTVLKKLGGTQETRQYVLECMEATSRAANIAAYSEIVKNASMLRAVRDIAYAVQEMAGSAQDFTEPLGYAVDRFTALQESGAHGELADGVEAMTDFYEYRDKFDQNPESMFVKTGFENLDGKLIGLVNSGLYILAARPGVGKTTFALHIADNVAERGFPVLFVSLEMSVRQITAKRIARRTGVPYNDLLMGNLNDEAYTKMAKASGDMAKLPVSVNRRPSATVPQIESMARKVKGVRLVVVDYVNLIKAAERKKSRYEEITDISNSLKQMAIRLGIPVLCLAQLNRESENEKGKRPRLYHLRDSGALEQDADAVMLLHTQERTEDQQEWEGIESTCYIDKNRHGNTGIIKFSFYGGPGKFVPIRERGY